MSTEIQIRSARPGDEQSIHQMVKELAEYERLASEAIATPEHFKKVLFCPQPKLFGLIAEKPQGQDWVAVGFSLYFFNFSSFLGRHGLYIEDLYVRPEQRGQGLGLRLFQELAQRAQQENCGRMEWSVLNWNENAIRFYKRLGAGPMSDWTVFRLNESGIAANIK